MEKDIVTINGKKIEYDRDALVAAIKAANGNAWRYRGCQYSVYLWDDGEITTSESFAGDNARLAAKDAHCIYTVTHQNDHPEDFDIEDWKQDVIARLSEQERAEYQRLVADDEDSDTYLLNSDAYNEHFEELVEWLANDSEDFDYTVDSIIDKMDDSRWN